ncbi:MAG TPA: thioredoxin domain-containing protein [Streptosporangiaceae bacterium]|nr:thioredoxin domain-containing protein [Streptosporangiaceae bacterium]
MADRLRGATSPYLLQHADNPVDWWPWGDEAFAAAAERGVPVLLSVGYSACHWCHVMAHESFENEQTAALMNEYLICIKVDREERPDVDSVYMTATQAMTGQGGWPMTVFMTPSREPFYCGTYFPRAQFERLVLSVARAWQEDRDEVIAQAGQIAAALAERAGPGPASPVTAGQAPAGAGGAAGAGEAADPASRLGAACDSAVATLAGEFDASRGGFGGAPKFPPSMVLEFLLRHSERATGTGAQQALAMAEITASAMARGGIYDQLAGGFARYSVDADWVVPHFEKMLYDNALLARVYAHLWRRTGSALARRVAEETCDWLITEMRTADGGFAAALDADSDGAEGTFYVWTPAELTAALEDSDGGYAAGVFGVTDAGTFEHGASVLQLRADPADSARLARVRAGLLAARAERTRPGRDDKVVASWNGLAIAALADCGLLFDRPDLISAATAAAELLTTVHLRAGRLARTSRDGRASATAGVLDDYGCVAAGLIALAGAVGADGASEPAPGGESGAARWLAVAGQLLEVALSRFGTGAGGFYDTADDSEHLIYRPADVADGPSPSGTFAVADALLSYSALTGSARHRDAAIAALGIVADLASRYPRAAGSGLATAEAVLSGPAEIAIAGPPTEQRAELHRIALTAAPPGAVLAVGDGVSETIPLLAGKGPVDGRAAAYVCRNFSCQAPVTEPEQLRAALGTPAVAEPG